MIERIKILHCVPDDKFIDGAISLFEQDDRVINTWCHFVQDPKEELQFIKNVQVMVPAFAELDKYAHQCDAIILHSFEALPIEQMEKLPDRQKIIWFGWGHDMYEGRTPIIPIKLYLPKTQKIYEELYGPKTVIKHIKHWIRVNVMRKPYSRIISRIDYFSGVFPYEYDLLAQKQPKFKGRKLDFYYASTSFFIKDECPCAITNDRKNVIIGNSAHITNNHMDAIDWVAEHVHMVDDCRVILPLSYGSEENYTNRVKEYAKSRLGNNIYILDSYLPIDEYWELVSNCKIAIFPHIRQQASDNIFYELMTGAKVYMTKQSLAYSYLKQLGLVVFSLEDDIATIDNTLSHADVMKNREILTELYSVSTQIERVHNIIATLITE